MNYENIIKGLGLKATPQRVDILSILDNYGGYMTIPDLHKRMCRGYPSLSLATIYASIHIFVGHKVVRVTLQNGKKVYGYNYGEQSLSDALLDIQRIVDGVHDKDKERLGKYFYELCR